MTVVNDTVNAYQFGDFLKAPDDLWSVGFLDDIVNPKYIFWIHAIAKNLAPDLLHPGLFWTGSKIGSKWISFHRIEA